MNTLHNNQNTRRNPPRNLKTTQSTKPSSKTVVGMAEILNTSTQSSVANDNMKRESMLSMDKEFAEDPLKVSLYCKDIFRHILEKEVS